MLLGSLVFVVLPQYLIHTHMSVLKPNTRMLLIDKLGIGYLSIRTVFL